MPKINLVHPHQKGKDAAKQIVFDAVENYKNRYTPESVNADGRKENISFDVTWGLYEADFVIKVAGMTIKGKGKIEDDKVSADLDIPFGVLPFKGKIERTVKEKLEKAFA